MATYFAFSTILRGRQAHGEDRGRTLVAVRSPRRLTNAEADKGTGELRGGSPRSYLTPLQLS